MKILIINSTPHTREFVDPIKNSLTKNNFSFEIVNYNNIPLNLNNYNGIIISASPKGNDIVDSQLQYFEWIKKIDVPILGICHGHHIIGVLHGSELIRNAQKEEGMSVIEVIESDPFFDGFKKNITVEQHHNDSISLPMDFYLLASSKKCKVQVIKHKTKSIYSVQFHCEKTPELILNFLKIIQGKFN
ncbi:type 1 glutamine amidotransferase [Bacteroidota bacterium]